jgi:zinc protease
MHSIKNYFSEITLDEVNKVASGFLTKENRVVMVSMPDKEGVAIPTEKEMSKIIDGIGSEKIEPYKDLVQNEPLVKEIKEPGKVIKETRNDKLDYTELRLNNGVRVILKKTDFKNDEIMMMKHSVQEGFL